MPLDKQMCGSILLYMCQVTTILVRILLHVSAHYYTFVHILLCTCRTLATLLYVCAHTTMHVSVACDWTQMWCDPANKPNTASTPAGSLYCYFAEHRLCSCFTDFTAAFDALRTAALTHYEECCDASRLPILRYFSPLTERGHTASKIK